MGTNPGRMVLSRKRLRTLGMRDDDINELNIPYYIKTISKVCKISYYQTQLRHPSLVSVTSVNAR